MFKQFNNLLALIYLPFILIWVGGTLVAVKLLGLSPVESLGLGTATGILLAILKDIFQFFFRKKSEEKH